MTGAQVINTDFSQTYAEIYRKNYDNLVNEFHKQREEFEKIIEKLRMENEKLRRNLRSYEPEEFEEFEEFDYEDIKASHDEA